MNDPSGFVPPPYPYDRLDRLVPLAKALAGGIVDLSIGTPCDPPTAEVLFALGHSSSSSGSVAQRRRRATPSSTTAAAPPPSHR